MRKQGGGTGNYGTINDELKDRNVGEEDDNEGDEEKASEPKTKTLAEYL